jgi:hypothetical protein
LLGHEAESAQQLGWAGILNRVLLKRAEETGFEVLITMDSNMTFQLNLAGNRLKTVVLRARSNRLADTIPSQTILTRTVLKALRVEQQKSTGDIVIHK